MKIDWFYIRMLVLVGLSVFLFVFAIHRNESRKIEEIAISFEDESTPFITRETVNKLLIVSSETVTGKAKENIALSKMEAGVKSHPIIKDADVYMTMSGQVGVSVEQRKPIVRVLGDTSFYIDEDGEMMPLSDNFSAHVPLVTGASKKEISEVYKLADFIRKDAFLAKHIIGLDRQRNGEYILKARKLDYSIDLGKVEQLEKRFSNYKAFYQKGFKDESLDTYKKIVLKFDGQVVCEKR